MTAYIVAVSLGDLPHGTLEYETIFAVGLTLVLMTLEFNKTEAIFNNPSNKKTADYVSGRFG